MNNERMKVAALGMKSALKTLLASQEEQSFPAS
jgi:hypothetical protein